VSVTPAEKDFSDFTLYFLAFNHSGSELTAEEKEKTLFAREGTFFLYPSR